MKAKAIIEELIPTNGQKSFYGKARILTTKGRVFLQSYDTIVGSVNCTGEVTRYSDWRSHTTCRHVKSFIETYKPGMTTKEFWSLQKERDTPELEITVGAI